MTSTCRQKNPRLLPQVLFKLTVPESTVRKVNFEGEWFYDLVLIKTFNNFMFLKHCQQFFFFKSSRKKIKARITSTGHAIPLA